VEDATTLPNGKTMDTPEITQSEILDAVQNRENDVDERVLMSSMLIGDLLERDDLTESQRERLIQRNIELNKMMNGSSIDK
jgi:hypothetical protein